MSMEPNRDREKVIEELHEALRTVSSETVMFHQAVADRLGLNSTDHKCLDMIRGCKSVTAGQLSEFTGLTTGSTTAMIDRLEAKGFVRREKSPDDRRQVVVVPVENEIARRIGPIFGSLQKSMTKMFSGYSNDELELLRRFATENAKLLHEEIQGMKSHDSDT